MKKKIMTLLLAMCMVMTLMPQAIFASGGGTVKASGDPETVYPITGDCSEDAAGTGNNSVSWAFDASSGTLTISGTGKMEGYARGALNNDNVPANPEDPSNADSDWQKAMPWASYREDITTVIIEEGVTKIGDYAFLNCTNLTNVEIAPSVNMLGRGTFSGCTELTTIELPYIPAVYPYAFANCDKLTTAKFAELKTGANNGLYYYAFEECTQLSDLYIANVQPPAIFGDYGHLFNSCSDVKIHVPIGKDETYRTTWSWMATTYPNAEIIGNAVKVTFESNSGTNVATQILQQGGTATAPTAPTKYGFDFEGWYTDSEYETQWNFADAVDRDTELYAKWTSTTASSNHTVTFYKNDGSEEEYITDTVADSGTISEPTAPTRTGYTFGGWFTEGTCTTGQEWNFETKVNDDINLYAKWTPIIYTVTFNTNEGSSVTEQRIAYGANVDEPNPQPTKDSYAFAGWYKEAEFVNVWDFTTDKVTEDTTLYAKWTPTAIPNHLEFGFAYDVQRSPAYPSNNERTIKLSGFQNPYDSDGTNSSTNREGSWTLTYKGTLASLSTAEPGYSNLTRLSNIAQTVASNYGLSKENIVIHELKNETQSIAYGVVVAYDEENGLRNAVFVGDSLSSGAGYFLSNSAVTSSEITANEKYIIADIVPTDNTTDAIFNATGTDCGTLSNLKPGMVYKKKNDVKWIEVEEETTFVELEGLKNGTVIEVKADENSNEVQRITLTRTVPDPSPTPVSAEGTSNGKITNVDSTMQYMVGESGKWIDITGTEITGLLQGTYYVRVTPSGTRLESDPVEVTIGVEQSGNGGGNGGGSYIDWNVVNVEKKIDAIGTVALDKADEIQAARDAYDKLKDYQQKKVENYQKLVDAEAELERLQKEQAEIEAIEKEKARIQNMNLAARSKSVVLKNGKKAVRIYWYEVVNGELKKLEDGAFDRVEVYRALKKDGNYGLDKQPFFTSVTDRYYNTAIKKGTRYYYKVRGCKTVGDEKVYTDYSLRAWRMVK